MKSLSGGGRAVGNWIERRTGKTGVRGSIPSRNGKVEISRSVVAGRIGVGQVYSGVSGGCGGLPRRTIDILLKICPFINFIIFIKVRFSFPTSAHFASNSVTIITIIRTTDFLHYGDLNLRPRLRRTDAATH